MRRDDDHPYSYLAMRNDAFRDADLIIILGTRTNYVIGHALLPRFSAGAKIARIEIDTEEMGNSARNIDLPIVGDCKLVLLQLCEAVPNSVHSFKLWAATGSRLKTASAPAFAQNALHHAHGAYRHGHWRYYRKRQD